MTSTEAAYTEDELATGFIKDFQQCDYSFMALLPREKGPEALQKLVQGFSFFHYNYHREDMTVHTSMPEFKIETEQNLKQACADLGITEALTTNGDFTPMSAFKLPAKRMTHRAKIEIDRNGASTTAADKANHKPTIPQKKAKKVILNRPFIFAIFHRSLNIPVLIGIINHLEDT